MLAEFAPLLVPQFDALLVSLVAIAVLVVALGLVNMVDNFVRAIFTITDAGLGWIPGVGRLISSPVHKIEQKIVNAMASAERGIDAKLGAYFHSLAKLAVWAVDELAAHASLLNTLATIMLGPDVARAIREAIAVTRHALDALRHQLADARRTITVTVPAKVGAVSHALSVRVGALAGELGHVIEWDIPRLRARDRAIGDELRHLWQRVRGLDRRVGQAAVAGALVYALAKIGAGWLQCRNWRQIGRQGCNMDSGLLDELLTDTLLIVGAVSVVEFAETLLAVEDEAVGVLGSIIREWPS